jgi:hypothetical protein
MDVFGQKIVFCREFRCGKDDLRVRKDNFDAVFFSQRLPDSSSHFLITIIDKWKFKGDNFIALKL